MSSDVEDKHLTSNEFQVGGQHYKGTQYEHWDWALDTSQTYLVGNATKYIYRWRKKAGVEDLRKALHYVRKLIEWAQQGGKDRLDMPFAELSRIEQATIKFSQANSVKWLEHNALLTLAKWTKLDDLYTARDIIKRLIEIEDERQPSMAFGEAVPLTEENHYSPRVGEPEDDDEG